MADRKITELGAAEATDLANDDTLLHIVNPDRVSASDRNRKVARTQLAELVPPRVGNILYEDLASSITLGPAFDDVHLLYWVNGMGGALTIPLNSTWPAPIGYTLKIVIVGPGVDVTLTSAVGVGLHKPSNPYSINGTGSATIVKLDTNTWAILSDARSSFS